MDLILIRRVNNQHTIDDLVHRLIYDRPHIVDGRFCEANKTDYTLKLINSCSCWNAVHDSLPCQGCHNIELIEDEHETFIDFE